jgi:hypothetical protein
VTIFEAWFLHNESMGAPTAVEQGFFEGLDVEVVGGGPGLSPIDRVMAETKGGSIAFGVDYPYNRPVPFDTYHAARQRCHARAAGAPARRPGARGRDRGAGPTLGTCRSKGVRVSLSALIASSLRISSAGPSPTAYAASSGV